ncbi:MAG: GNAT family N-acetyltransferase [Thermoplasmata archaeon]
MSAVATAAPTVRLRPPRPDDLPEIFPWYNDPEIVAPFDRFNLDTFEGFRRSVAEAPLDEASTAPRFIVERIADGRRLGFVGYYRSHPVLALTDIWYVLGDPHERGKGYGREAVGQLIDHLFATTDVARVGATCDVENVPSYRLLERLGFRREGTLRDALFHHGRWHDVALYGITRSEWPRRPST